MQKHKYVIIGGGLAGARAGDGIRSIDDTGSIALLAAEHHLPYRRFLQHIGRSHLQF